MKNKITIAAVMGIFLISLVSAVVIPAGTSDIFQINTTETLFYDIVGNTTSTEGLNITQDIFDSYSIITIAVDFMYKADSFTIIFFNKEKETIYEYSSGGGGGSSYCGPYEDDPEPIPVEKNQTKEVDEEEIIEEVEEKKGSFGVFTRIIAISWVGGMIGLAIYLLVRRRRERDDIA